MYLELGSCACTLLSFIRGTESFHCEVTYAAIGMMRNIQLKHKSEEKKMK